MTDEKPRGMKKGLTAYGDQGFSLFLRKAFIKAMGYTEDSLNRPIIGITNTFSGYNACHRNVPDLIEGIKRGVMLAGGLPIEFPVVSLHESFAHPTSMYLRNLMAIDTEEMIRAQPMDACVLIGGCDKTVPALLMGAASANVPAVLMVTGPMMTGDHKGERLGACTDCRRFWGKYRGNEIDAREIPPDWTTGMVPLRKSRPYELPKEVGDTAEVFRLDAGLTEWAYQLTRDVPLTESPEMREERARYPEGVVRRPPFVLKGDNLSSSAFWIGAKLTDWANDWVRYHTGGQGSFVTSAMEDSGTVQSLTWLSRAGKVDIRRVLVLRAGSDHDLPPPGRSAAEALARTKIGQYAAYGPAIENAYRVGAAVVEALLAQWSTYRDTPPVAAPRR